MSYGLLYPIFTCHLILPPFLHRHLSANALLFQVLPSHQDLAWFASTHLHLPPCSLTLSTQTCLHQCFAPIKSSPHIKTWLGLLCPQLCSTPCSLILPHRHVLSSASFASNPHCIKQDLTWFSLSPSSPDTLFSHPPSPSLHSAPLHGSLALGVML